mmetsp:Transcript_9896/g.30103  ORF Transcript_9896/g.30103 Transcript_9896/m.30103 type:complete len:436 (-) Transcript_9896:161-1468(-)
MAIRHHVRLDPAVSKGLLLHGVAPGLEVGNLEVVRVAPHRNGPVLVPGVVRSAVVRPGIAVRTDNDHPLAHQLPELVNKRLVRPIWPADGDVDDVQLDDHGVVQRVEVPRRVRRLVVGKHLEGVQGDVWGVGGATRAHRRDATGDKGPVAQTVARGLLIREIHPHRNVLQVRVVLPDPRVEDPDLDPLAGDALLPQLLRLVQRLDLAALEAGKVEALGEAEGAADEPSAAPRGLARPVGGERGVQAPRALGKDVPGLQAVGDHLQSEFVLALRGAEELPPAGHLGVSENVADDVHAAQNVQHGAVLDRDQPEVGRVLERYILSIDPLPRRPLGLVEPRVQALRQAGLVLPHELVVPEGYDEPVAQLAKREPPPVPCAREVQVLSLRAGTPDPGRARVDATRPTTRAVALEIEERGVGHPGGALGGPGTGIRVETR